MMYVLKLPILSCKRLGEVKHIDKSGSKNRELHLHFANMKLPECLGHNDLNKGICVPMFSLHIYKVAFAQ